MTPKLTIWMILKAWIAVCIDSVVDAYYAIKETFYGYYSHSRNMYKDGE